METQVFILNTHSGYNIIQELQPFIMTWLDISDQLDIFPTLPRCMTVGDECRE